MASLIRVPLKIAKTAAKVPLGIARFGIERVFGREEETVAAPPAAPAPPPPRTAQRTAPRATTAKPAAKKASEAKKRTAKAKEPANPVTAEQLEGEPGHVDRDAVNVMSLGPAADPGPEITIDPEVRKLGGNGSGA